MNRNEVTVSELEFSYPSTLFSGKRNLAKDNPSFIGQPRAINALCMGMSIFSKSYNIFLSGDPGSGRHEAIRYAASVLKERGTYTPKTVVFAYNFASPKNPLAICTDAKRAEKMRLLLEDAALCLENGNTENALYAISEIGDAPEIRGFISTVKQEISCGRITAADASKIRVSTIPGRDLLESRPLVFESHPEEENLFGRVTGTGEYEHLCIYSGSVFDALEGYLVIDAERLLSDSELWNRLKKFLNFGTLMLKNPAKEDSVPLRIKAVNLPLKVILVGTDALYDKFCEADESFLELFGVSAEFDFSMPANEHNILLVCGFLDRFVRDNALLPLSDDAIARLLFYSSWYAELRGELTTKLSFLSGLVREADFWTRTEGKNEINSKSVDKAMEMRDYVNSLTEMKIADEIRNGEMMISLSGSKVGVLNGLAVMDRGNASFGTPTVISVSVAPGTEGIVNIEHEAGLSGEIHDKGLLILEGYLRKHYARNFPLSMYAGICFEQSYGEVDGDSASSAELFALLSAIGDIPLRQEIAVTGSVNQLGDIQPVGGINEKITGYFHICCIDGLTGRQGVIIPRQNLNSLLLGDEIIEAVRDGKFHIYSIQTIDEGMEILTNRIAGTRGPRGNFPAGTLNNIIENSLKNLCNLSRPAN